MLAYLLSKKRTKKVLILKKLIFLDLGFSEAIFVLAAIRPPPALKRLSTLKYFMDLYLIIGLTVVLLLLFIFRKKSKKEKLKTGQELSDNFKETETTIVENNYLQSLPDNSDFKDFPEKLIEVVNKIIAIPKDFHELGNKSFYQLVIDSGYINAYEQITNKIIRYALTQQSHRVKEWVQWSEDQRVSEGWFLREDNNIWNIGEFSTKDGYKESLTPYANLTSACADFIKLELEYIKQLVEIDQRKKIKKKAKQ